MSRNPADPLLLPSLLQLCYPSTPPYCRGAWQGAAPSAVACGTLRSSWADGVHLFLRDCGPLQDVRQRHTHGAVACHAVHTPIYVERARVCALLVWCAPAPARAPHAPRPTTRLPRARSLAADARPTPLHPPIRHFPVLCLHRRSACPNPRCEPNAKAHPPMR